MTQMNAGKRIVETERRPPQAKELSENDLSQVVGGLAHPLWADGVIAPTRARRRLRR